MHLIYIMLGLACIFSSFEPLHLTFFSLSSQDGVDLSWQGREAEVRGFLYKDLTGKIILAEEPNLKSCCVGASKNALRQIVVSGNLPESLPSKAVTLMGKFFIEPKFDKEGKLLQKYSLADAAIVPEDSSLTYVYILGALFLVLLLPYFWKRSNRLLSNTIC